MPVIGRKYFNWDNSDDRRVILSGPTNLARASDIGGINPKPPTVVFDELHKHVKWKSLIKGFFDTYQKQVRIIVTGSSRMDVFRRGGDSLMGRYFLYRMHP